MKSIIFQCGVISFLRVLICPITKCNPNVRKWLAINFESVQADTVGIVC